MISFAQPKIIPLFFLENLTPTPTDAPHDIPADFPYVAVILQGRPKHVNDEFAYKHPKMDRGKRAKIFAPFDALDGYSDAVKSKDVEYVQRVDFHEDGLAEEERDELARRMEILHTLTLTGRQARKNQVVVTVTYFVPCEDENNFSYGIRGLYKHVTGICWRVDFVGHTMTVDKAAIHLDDIVRLDNPNGIFDIEWELEGS